MPGTEPDGPGHLLYTGSAKLAVGRPGSSSRFEPIPVAGESDTVPTVHQARQTHMLSKIVVVEAVL